MYRYDNYDHTLVNERVEFAAKPKAGEGTR
jgi:hypothetical protein